MADFWESEKELVEAFDRGKIPLMTFLREMESKRGQITADPALGTAVIASFSRHTEGRDLISLLLEANGFRTVRVERDTSIEDIVKLCCDEEVTVLCLSVQATWDLENIEKADRLLKEMGIRDRILLNAGGGAVSEQVAERFGCDVFAETAVKTCTLIRKTVAERHR